MVKKINHKELNRAIKLYYESKIALMVWGTFGIGKSYVLKDSAIEIAESKKKEFIEWNKVTEKKKQEIYKNPKKYFCLIDERLSEYDSSDIKGLPNFKSDGDTLEWRMPMWAKFITQKGSDGIILFDEINLATPLVISSVYKIIYDRIIGEDKIADGWGIFGAGNLDSDNAHTHTLASPVKDRGGEVELTISDIDSWSEWAIKNGIMTDIISFLNFKPTALYDVEIHGEMKYTTTRGWERVNKLISNLEDKSLFDLAVLSAIGEGNGREFIAFTKLKEKMNIKDIIKNPKKIGKITAVDMKYIIVTGVAEMYDKNKIDFGKIVEISEVFDKGKSVEFVTLLWRLCARNSERFEKDFINSDGKNAELIKKYMRYFEVV